MILFPVVVRAGDVDPMGLGSWLGARGKVAWVQDNGSGSDTFGRSRDLVLYGYDSADNKGEHPLLNERGNFFKPLFTPDGKQVIVSDRLARVMYLVDWKSGSKKKLGSGVAVAIWQDPKPSFFLRKKTTWVYCFSGQQRENRYGTGQPLYRFPLDDPDERELIWNKTNMAWSNLQLSRDGKVIGGLFPWPHGGVLDTATKKWKRLGRGCWTSMSPDNSKLFWIFDGLHRNVQIHDLNNGSNWKVNINGGPGIGGFEVYHPRWSNHPRYFVVTGPYEKGEGGNKITGGGEKVEILVGRFDKTAHKVEDWLQLTRNHLADFYPDLWVEGGGAATLAEPVKSVATKVVAESWPVRKKNLLFLWEDMKAPNQLDEKSPGGFFQCNLSLRGRALFNSDLELSAGGGWAETGEAGKRIGEGLKKSNTFSLEFLIGTDGSMQGAFVTLAKSGSTVLQMVQDGKDMMMVNHRGEKVLWTNVFNGTAHHLVVNGKDDQLELYLDGKSMGRKKLMFDLKKGLVDTFRLGEESGRWGGRLSHIAIHNTVLSSAEIAGAADLVLKKAAGRKALPNLVVQGRLLESSSIPAPDSLGAYRRALVVNVYAVEKVVEGSYAEENILVAEWAVLDRTIVKSYTPTAQVEALHLEKFELHPELEGERQMMDVFEPDLTMYYRVPE